jgi:hypothetical protein
MTHISSKTSAQITKTTVTRTAASVQLMLSRPPAPIPTTTLGENIYTLPDRTYLTGSIRNRTRIRTRFSSPGGFETLSRGFLDPAHETYAAGNALTYRNPWPRKVHNSQLQAHCGRFGVSTHDTTTARVSRERTRWYDSKQKTLTRCRACSASQTHRCLETILKEWSCLARSQLTSSGMTVLTASSL